MTLHGIRSRLLFGALALLGVVFSMEIAMFLSLSALEGTWMHPMRFAELRERSVRESADRFFGVQGISTRDLERPDGTIEVLHPYVGYVVQPSGTGALVSTGTITGHGFIPSSNAFASPHADVAIGIFGGSVAENLGRDGAETLIMELQRSPMYHGRTLSVSAIALGGYKQPQQLLALEYFQSLGVRFDIVIVLDGFNDIALPMAENIPQGISPFFPVKWALRTRGVLDPDILPIAGQISYLRQKRREWAGMFSRFPLSLSPTASSVWRAWDNILARRIATREVTFLTTPPSVEWNYVQRGPSVVVSDTGALLREIVAVWGRSSRQMSRAVEADHGLYIHVLQPNQYVEGSKPMGDAEREQAILTGHPYGRWVREGYPLLREEGKRLREAQVNFHDATMLFLGHPEPLYVDSCCHFGVEGSRILARFIAEAIVREARSP